MVSLVHDRIDAGSLCRSLLRAEDGAAVTFEGVVRDHARGRRVIALEYQAYESMALKKLEAICAQARRDYPIRDIAIVHRLGRLEPLDCSVAIVVLSAHRAAAFEACRYSIERLKREVPIWKKEFYEDGSCWIEEGGAPLPPSLGD